MSELKNNLQNELNNDNNANNSKKRGRPPLNRTAVVPSPAPASAPMGANLADDSRANRPKRIPVGSQNRLNISTKPGFRSRVVKVQSGKTDLSGRVQEFINAGYVPREGDFTTYVRSKDPSSMGSNYISLGRGDYGILMDIREEFYVEDQAAKVKRNENNLEALKKARNVEQKYMNTTKINNE
jgi:hypothetical protein